MLIMSNVNEAYINALLADAEYAINGLGEYDLLLELSKRLTPAQAEFINDNFTVVTHVESESGFDSTVWPGRDRERFSINLTHDLTLTFSYDLILPFFGSSPCILTTSKRLFKP
jgi:hypothetical protein